MHGSVRVCEIVTRVAASLCRCSMAVATIRVVSLPATTIGKCDEGDRRMLNYIELYFVFCSLC